MTKEQKALYTAMGFTGQTVVRHPGQIDGQQFIVDSCKDCVIRIFDHCAQVTIDDCVGCEIIVGPCADSVFARDCRDCTFHAVCQQWRTRDCVDCKLSLWCPNDPVIEGCSGMEIGPWYISYPKLSEHFKSAELDASQPNKCLEIYNFTPPDAEEDAHWRPDEEHAPLNFALEGGAFGPPETPLASGTGAPAPASAKPAATKKQPKKAVFTSDAAPAPVTARPPRPPRSAGSTAALVVACVAALLGGNAALDSIAGALFPTLFASPELAAAAAAAAASGGAGSAEGAMAVPLPLAISGMVFTATLLGLLSSVPPLTRLRLLTRLICALPAAAVYVWVAAKCNAEMAAKETFELHTLPTAALLTAGPFELSRHPLYAATSLALLGGAILINSRWLVALMLPWLLYLQLWVVAEEEAYLGTKFGADHAAYSARVPVWMPAPWLDYAVIGMLSVFVLHLLSLLVLGSGGAAGAAATSAAGAAGDGKNGPKSDVCVLS